MSFVLYLLVLIFFGTAQSTELCAPHLLIKIPTRSRPEKFLQVLDLYYQKLSGEIPYHFVISCDSSDTSMNNVRMIEQIEKYPHITLFFTDNRSKVEAYNQGVDSQTWTIIIVGSDDMIPQVEHYDKIIVKEMLDAFPDYDGVLNFNDGYVGGKLNTYPVIGRKYYNRFGFIYNPVYKSLFCDEEFTKISKKINKEKVCNQVLLRHEHPCNGYNNVDRLYLQNEILEQRDRKTIRERERNNFGISEMFWL